MHLALPVIIGFLLGATIAFIAALLRPHDDRRLLPETPVPALLADDLAGPSGYDERMVSVPPTEDPR